jgi:sulfite exporter TauE/SafE
MLMFWVLGLAASTGGALTGAAVMVGLVVMTTPVLLIAGTSPLLARGKMRQWGDTVAALALLISGVWLGLVGAAANGWIDHLHFMFAIGEQSFKMMLW